MSERGLVLKGVAFRLQANRLSVYIEHGTTPHLPSLVVRRGKSLDAEAQSLFSSLGINGFYSEQLYSFSAEDLGQLGDGLTVAYFALVGPGEFDEANWQIIDHSHLPASERKILQTALARLRAKIRYQPLGLSLLPKKFTLTQLQALYEATLERNFDKRNFRKKWLSSPLLKPLNETERAVARRAARLYAFDRAGYQGMLRRGSEFHI